MVELVMKVSQQTKDSLELVRVLEQTEAAARMARRHRHSLDGSGFYATKFSEGHGHALVQLQAIEAIRLEHPNDDFEKLKTDLRQAVAAFFTPAAGAQVRGQLRKQVKLWLTTRLLPRLSEPRIEVVSDSFFPLSIIDVSKDTFKVIAHQACGCYDKGWYDAAAVMARRLLESLIIEVFESHGLAAKAKGSGGDFLFLRDLIGRLSNEPTFNLSRNAKSALPKLKELGDLSAHSRRYSARKPDIDKIKADLRICIEELKNLARLK